MKNKIVISRTEKLWRSFYVGSVPLVYGSAKSKELFPDPHSAIEILDYKSPSDLAVYLKHLNENDNEYDAYLNFKKPGGVTNPTVIELLGKREWGINNDAKRMHMIDAFQCMVCERIHENMERESRGEPIVMRQAGVDHYGCPFPYTFSEDGVLLDERYRDTSKWRDSMFKTSYELAYVAQKLFFDGHYNKGENSSKLSYKQFQKEIWKHYREKLALNSGKRIDL
jgi:hypothetical protein